MKTFEDQFHAAVEIGAMLQGADMVKLAVAEMIRACDPRVIIEKNDQGFAWDYEWSTPGVNTARVRGLLVEFIVVNEDMSWRGWVPAADVLDELAKIEEEP